MAHRTLVRLGSVLLCVVSVAAVIGFAATTIRAAKATLTVYTAVEADDLKKYAARFNEDHPDIEIKWVRDSTGVITAKLLAEKANPQADVVWGVSATSLMVLKLEGMLMPYAPKGLEKLDAQFRDRDNPPTWVGMDAYVAVICFNTVEAQKKNLPKPSSWKDLTKPVYKGTIVMPNPASSGTGFLQVSAWRSRARWRGRASTQSASPSSSAAPGSRSRARRSTSSSRPRSPAGTWRRPPS